MNNKLTDKAKLFDTKQSINFPPLTEKLQKVARDFVENSKFFNKSSHQIFMELSKMGWYINEATNILDTITYKKLLSKNDKNALDKLMSKQIKKDYKALKEKTLQTFSDKKEILERAFIALEKKQYEYSILVFLTQTDSICKKITGTRLFGRNNKEAKTKKIANAFFNEMSFISAVLQPLSEYGEINKSESDFIEGEFNRHKIIHGDDINYGNETNAYKIISLVFYITTIVTKRTQ